MEFLKHRQRVVSEASGEIGKPAEQKLPPFLSEYQPAQMMKKQMSDAANQHKKVKDKIEKIIENPSANDEVYKCVNRLFKHNGTFVLGRKTEGKGRIRSLARKRFALGYPPRKNNDLSVGDAVNWEWIVHCAQKCPDKSNVVIVSRDGDFGVRRGKKNHINDWLKKEFQERVSRKRKVVLTELLSEAFKKVDVSITKEVEDDERGMVREARDEVLKNYADALSKFGASRRARDTKNPDLGLEFIRDFIEEIKKVRVGA